MRVLAVDLGATSVRVAAVDLDAPQPSVEVIHRWPHEPVTQPDGSLRWDWPGIVAAVERGLEAGLEAGPVASIGVDGWGVDYGLLDEGGELLSLPYSYRDERTSGWRRTAEDIGADRLYRLTGIQLLPINTIFQLAAHDRAELDRARRLLLVPDLLVRHLTGLEGTELSNASTTGLLHASTGTWAAELLDAVGIAGDLPAPLTPAGRPMGSWHGVPVHTVGSHDTASAFVAAPGVPGPRTAIVSSGTWVLVGSERPAVDASEAARAANFSNERGALGGVRFLKNVMGFWMLERCRAEWGGPPIEELVSAAVRVDADIPTVDATDARFLAPADMEAEVRTAAGLEADASRAEVVRCILESIAAAAAGVVTQLGTITGEPAEELFVVGGGTRMPLMNELLASHTGLPVTVGSPEAAALGNAAVQGLALGRFTELDQARRWVATAADRLAPAAPRKRSR